jgi:heat shock protein HspQ
MGSSRAKFSVGELIVHRLFDYRGVIVDVDASFQGTDDWYDAVARSRPPKDAPWYHVLVSGATHATYVAERNLSADSEAAPAQHPMLDHFFDQFRDGRYVRKHTLN